MKAILVIDVDNTEDYVVEVIKKRTSAQLARIVHTGLKLKPMPQRKKSLIVADGDGARFEEPTEFEQGYNACIDEILGE